MSRAYTGLIRLCGIAAALLLGVVAVLVSFDVVVRNIGLGTFPWIVEVSEYSLPLATFLIAPWLLHRGEHVRIDMVLTALPGPLARLVARAADLLGLAISAVFLFYGIRVIRDSMGLDSLVIKTMVFPEWWLFLPVPFCFALLAIEFARRLRMSFWP
ncbi:MAG: TRAP transporter small permease [Alphaproteobacteria bacterium]|nr:TRAP transporter small permease [Alphaproteobacteria bacterium]